MRAKRLAGATLRELAAYFGRSKWTIVRVIKGRGPHARTMAIAVLPDADPDWPAKPLRCDGCGCTVRGDLPCGICAARAAHARRAPLDPRAVDAIMAELGRD